MNLRIAGQSVAKADNDLFANNMERINEDALFIGNNIFAIADGAGGTGIMANKWAEKLLSCIPDKPFESPRALNVWISGFWEDFYKEHLSSLQQDHWQLNKFEDEGSSATLSAIWQLSHNNFEYNSYGDSALFIYNKQNGTLRIQQDLISINSFTGSPPLLNWKSEEIEEKHFYREKFTLKPDEVAILATDGMAMFIYGAYLTCTNAIKEEIQERKMQSIVNYFRENTLSDFKSLLQSIHSALNSKESFSQLTRDWHKNKCLPNDDYTIVWIEKISEKHSQLKLAGKHSVYNLKNDRFYRKLKKRIRKYLIK